MPDVVTGAALTLAGFGLATLRDAYKQRRDRRGRQRAVLLGYKEEMLANHSAAENTLNLIAYERRSRQQREIKALINPASRLEHGAWPIARVELPSRLLRDQELMQRLRHIHRNTLEVNSLVESLENFRIQHVGGDNALFDQGLEGYAVILIEMLRDLKRRIEHATDDLSPYLRHAGSRQRWASWRAARICEASRLGCAIQAARMTCGQAAPGGAGSTWWLKTRWSQWVGAPDDDRMGWQAL